MIFKSSEFVGNPLCSVFIFTYNQENLVSQTIDSVLEQECSFPFEIIIVEDCGKDRTKEICVEYQKNNPDKIIVISNDENMGIVRNYHEKIYQYARGKYVAECAGDDYWCDPLKLQKQVQFLEANPDYGLVHTSVRVLNVDTGTQHEMIKFDLNEGLREFFIENKVAALTVCFRLTTFKEYCDNINPLQQDWHSEDYPMWLYFSGHTKIKVLEDVTAVYRVYVDSMSRPRDLNKFVFRIKTRLRFRRFYLNYYNMNSQFCDDIIYLTYREAHFWAGKAHDKAFCKEIKYFYDQNKFRILSFFMSLYIIFPSAFPFFSLIERFMVKYKFVKTKKFPNNSYILKKVI